MICSDIWITLRPRPEVLATFGAGFLLWATTAIADCRVFQPWRDSRDAITAPGLSVTQRAAKAEREWQAREALSHQLYSSYLRGTDLYPLLKTCLARDPDRLTFLNALQDIFFKRSLEQLKTFNLPTLRKLTSTLDSRAQNGALPLMRLTGHFLIENPAKAPGGASRVNGSVYLDVARIPVSDYFVILIHELLHSVDPVLPLAAQTYADPTLVQSFQPFLGRASKLSELPEIPRRDLQRWIQAGLNRGLLAEYRAWVYTWRIYREGRARGSWGAISWLDALVKDLRPGTSPERAIYLALDRKSPDPTDGIFSQPLIQNALREARADYRSGKLIPSL